MTGILTAIAAILVFGGVVLVHEWGHFILARRNGIRVLEFAIGMGPKLWSKKVNGTEYSIRLLPIGGFNRMLSREEEEQLRQAGEEVPEYEPGPGSYYEDAAPWRRLLVLAAGPAMNVVLGFALLVVLLSGQELLATRQVAQVDPDSQAAASGLQAEDLILEVNGRHCFVYQDIYYELERTSNDQADILVRRNGEKVLLENVKFDRVTMEDGYSYLDIGFKVYGVEPGLLTTPKAAFQYTIYYAKYIFTSLFDLFTGRVGINNLSGPVGIVSAINEAVMMGWDEVLNMAILISINLGIFNLIPIPGLDGGQIIFTGVEAVLRRPISAKIRNAVNMAGLMALIFLAIFATYQDILRLLF